MDPSPYFTLPTLSRLPSLPAVDAADPEDKLDSAKLDKFDTPTELISSDLSGFNIFAEGEERITWYLWLVLACTSISGLLFGYDTGVISGALIYIKGDLGPPELSDSQKELITTAATLGALIGGLFAGIIADYMGRKWVFGMADLIFVAGSLCQALANNVHTLIGGRVIVGIGVGFGMCIAPLYTQELAPTRQRGRMVAFTIVAVCLGQALGYGLSSGFEDVSRGWRWMFGVGAVLAFVQFFFLTYVPESPRYLMRRGEYAAVEAIITRTYFSITPEEVTLKVQALQRAVQESADIHAQTTVWQRLASLFREPANRRALMVACGLQALQQLCGFNTLMYYSASLFQTIGFNNPTGVGIIVAATNLSFTLLATRYIDIIGRRKIMLWSVPIMWLGLAFATVSFHFLTLKTGGRVKESHMYPKTWSALVLFSMLVYISGYAAGLGNVPWQQAELFALDVRGIGSSIATATNWSCGLLVAGTYMPLMNAISAAGTFGVYAGFVIVGLVFVYFCYPETAGLSLEEIKLVFKRDFGIATAARLRQEKREIRTRLPRRRT